MTQQETGGSGTGEPDLTEEVQTQPETANQAGTEMPALNRAERRAQAKGKKAGGSGPSSSLPASGVVRGSNPRPTGATIPVRVNRTGSRSK